MNERRAPVVRPATRCRPWLRLAGLAFTALLGLARAGSGQAPPAATDATDAAGAAGARFGVAPPTPPEVVERIVALGLQQSTVMERLDELVNGIGPRLTGSSQLAAAERWAADSLAALGLPARLERWGEVAVGFDRCRVSGALVAPEHQPLQVLTRAWSAGTTGRRRGPALLAPRDAAELEAVRAHLPGAYVLTPRNWPPAPRGDEPPAELGDDPAARSAWIERALGAHRAFTEARSAAYAAAGIAGRVLPSASGELLVMGGRLPKGLDELSDELVLTLPASQFEALRTRVEAGQAVELEFDVDVRLLPGPIPQHNVVADLRGSRLPEEYVLVGAHLDSWDGATGTTDNGTGVATTLEAARLLVETGARPARTIRFVLFGGEEQGLLGSRAFVEQHAAEMPAISAVLVHDGGTNALSGLGITRAMQAQVEQALQPVLRLSHLVPGGRRFELATVPGLEPGASDHNPFLEQGVPAFFWEQDGPADYDFTHHTQHDVFGAAIAEEQRHSAVVVALAALGLADLPLLLERRGLRRVQRTLGVFLGDDGLTVTRVAADSQAQALGLQPGDRFVSLDGEPLAAGALNAARDRGEGRKYLGWQRGDALLHGVFAWDEGHIERDPEPVVCAVDDATGPMADWYMGRVAGAAHGAAVVLLLDPGSPAEDWRALRAALYDAGLASVRLGARSPADIAAVVAWLERRDFPAARIALFAVGAAVPLAEQAACADRRLAGLALLFDEGDSGAATQEEGCVPRLTGPLQPAGWQAPTAWLAGLLAAGSPGAGGAASGAPGW